MPSIRELLNSPSMNDQRRGHADWMAESQDRIRKYKAEVEASLAAAREQPIAADNAAREAAAAEFAAGAADGDARITEGMRLRAAGANPAQEVSVPTQEQAEKWKTWVSGSAARQERYDPAAADARFAERVEDHRKHRDATMSQYGVRPETLASARVPPHIRRKQWMKEVAVRYKDQLAKDPSLMHKLMAEYDGGIAESGAQPLPSGKPGGPVNLASYRTPHFHGAASARNLTDVLDAQKAAQIATNVQRGWDQTNAGRQLGMSRGQVMAMQDIQESLDKGDKASAAAKMAMYGVSPSAYKGMLAVAEADVKKEPTTPGVVESYEKERGRLDGLGAGDGRLAGIDTFHRQRLGGKDAPPDAVQEAVRLHYQPYAQEMASRGIANLKPEERIEFQQATRGMDYTAWLRYCGQGDTPENRQAYRDLTGRSTGWADMGRTAVDWLVPDGLWNGVFGGA